MCIASDNVRVTLLPPGHIAKVCAVVVLSGYQSSQAIQNGIGLRGCFSCNIAITHRLRYRDQRGASRISIA